MTGLKVFQQSFSLVAIGRPLYKANGCKYGKEVTCKESSDGLGMQEG